MTITELSHASNGDSSSGLADSQPIALVDDVDSTITQESSDLRTTDGTENSAISTVAIESKGNQQQQPDCTQEEMEFPKALYCPLTNQLFEDPVVAADGETYEKAAYLERRADAGDDDVANKKLYTNRALKRIIDDVMLRRSGSIQASLKRLHYTAERTLAEFLEPSSSSPSTNQDSYYPLSEGFHCPITFNLIFDPVIDPEGNTYERVAAENWISVNGNSPVTRSTLTVEELYPNHVIRRLLEEEKNKSDDTMHPDIRRWKDEPAPKATDVEHGGGIVTAAAANAAITGSYVLPGVYPPPPLPSTHLQRYQRRMARRQTIVNVVGVCVCILSVAGLIFLGRSFFLLMFMMTLIIIFSKRRPI